MGGREKMRHKINSSVQLMLFMVLQKGLEDLRRGSKATWMDLRLTELCSGLQSTREPGGASSGLGGSIPPGR